MAKKRPLEVCGLAVVPLPRGQRRGGNPFSRRCVMASPPPCRQRKNNSHSPDPPAFGRLRTGREAPTRRRHAAFFVGGLRVVLKRAPVRFPEILLRMFPPRRQRRAPFPVPCVCVSLSRLSSIVGRNLCDAPRASRSTFAGTCRHSGPASCADRLPPRGQGRSKSNALAASERSRSGRKSL